MIFTSNLLVLWLHFVAVTTYRHEKPVEQIRWRGECTQNPVMLNDCNWCRCNKRQEYVCDARVCSGVDTFGHFKDTIAEFNPGMEGHGAWRSRTTACEPNVQYRRADLLCVCNNDGSWPNPICRDTFRILYSPEVTGVTEVRGQECEFGKLYLVGCNVCFCPKKGRLSPDLCTSRECTHDDPVVKSKKELAPTDPEEESIEIYAQCSPERKYKLGCKACVCLRNNRLLCDKCTKETESNNLPSYCDQVRPQEIFHRDCNTCYCDHNGYVMCTTKKCLSPKSVPSIETFDNHIETEDTFDEDNCVPGHYFKKDCNSCYCVEHRGSKYLACTLKGCGRSRNLREIMHNDCVKGTMYELNCLLCHCEAIGGTTTQICQVNPKCKGREVIEKTSNGNLDSLHGYCEPMHAYREDCNTCKCLGDGKTVRCTSYICNNEDAVSVEIVPIRQAGRPCPKGLSYKIDCNYCYCLSNGNAICSTLDCVGKEN